MKAHTMEMMPQKAMTLTIFVLMSPRPPLLWRRADLIYPNRD
jgi:hypothetical protein